MNQERRLKAVLPSLALCAALVCGFSGTAKAGSITETGETVGLALGATLPEGFYFVDTGSYISRDNGVAAVVNIPVFAYSSNLKLLGGTPWGYIAIPEVAVGLEHPAGTGYWASMYNPALLVGLAWDLGNGFGISNVVGGYGPMEGEVEKHVGLGCNCWVFNERAAISYTGNGMNLTAHVIYGSAGQNQTTHTQTTPDYINVDLTATKAIGKWEIGPVAYMSSDVSKVNGAAENSQFAVGGLVGYNFGPVVTQAYLTHDVTQSNYGGEDTRFYLRFIVPLGSLVK